MGLEKFNKELQQNYHQAVYNVTKAKYYKRTPETADIILKYTDLLLADYAKKNNVFLINSETYNQNRKEQYTQSKMTNEQMLEKIIEMRAELNNYTKEEKETLKKTLIQYEFAGADRDELINEMVELNYKIYTQKQGKPIVEKQKVLKELKAKKLLDIPIDSMVDVIIQPELKSYAKNSQKDDEKVLEVLAGKGPKFQDVAMISFFIQDEKHRKIARTSVGEYENSTDKFASTEEFLNGSVMRNVFGTKTDVTKLEGYSMSTVVPGLKTNFQKDYYQKYLNKMQNIQIDVPKSIDDKTAELIIIGEFLNKDYAKTIYKSGSLFNQKLGNADWESWVSSHWFNSPNRKRPNEWAFITIGEKARTNAKKIINDVDQRPDKAANNLERVIRTLTPYAYNMTNFLSAAPHARLVSAAFEMLQSKKFANYSTLSESEIENCQALVGVTKSMDQFRKTAIAYNDLKLRALALNQKGKVIDDPLYKKVYEDYAVDAFIQNYFSNIQTPSAKVTGSVNGTEYAPDPFSVAYGQNPNLAREKVREVLHNNPQFVKFFNEANCIDGLENSAILKNQFVGMRIFSSNPGRFHLALKDIHQRLEHNMENLNKIQLPEEYDDLNEASIEAYEKWEDYYKTASMKMDFSAEDLTKVKELFDEMEKAEAPLLKTLKEAKHDAAGPLEWTHMYTKDFRDLVNGELTMHEQLAPAIEAVESFNKVAEPIKENIEYEQYRIRIALDKAQSLAKKMAEADSPTKEQIESYNTSFKEYNKVITKACASLLANQSVWSSIADSPKTNITPKEIESISNKEAIETTTKTILKMPAFKKMMQSLSPEKLHSIAAVSDTEFHKKPVEDFFKQFKNEIKPKELQPAKTQFVAQAGI